MAHKKPCTLQLFVALMTLVSARALSDNECYKCEQENGWTKECEFCRLWKRSKPSYSDFGAFIPDWVKPGKSAPSPVMDSCDLIDMYPRSTPDMPRQIGLAGDESREIPLF